MACTAINNESAACFTCACGQLALLQNYVECPTCVAAWKHTGTGDQHTLQTSHRLRWIKACHFACDGHDAAAQEANAINKSLTFLEQTVNALSKKEGHVPFRQSKLTSLLRDALGGNCKTVRAVAGRSGSDITDVLGC